MMNDFDKEEQEILFKIFCMEWMGYPQGDNERWYETVFSEGVGLKIYEALLVNNTNEESEYLELKAELDLLKTIRESQGNLISKIHEEKLLLKTELETLKQFDEQRSMRLNSEIVKLKAELEKARELIKVQSKFLSRFKDGFYLNNSYSEMISLYRDLIDFEAKEFLKIKEGTSE